MSVYMHAKIGVYITNNILKRIFDLVIHISIDIRFLYLIIFILQGSKDSFSLMSFHCVALYNSYKLSINSFHFKVHLESIPDRLKCKFHLVLKKTELDKQSPKFKTKINI